MIIVKERDDPNVRHCTRSVIGMITQHGRCQGNSNDDDDLQIDKDNNEVIIPISVGIVPVREF
jgi:hypothetical protein